MLPGPFVAFLQLLVSSPQTHDHNRFHQSHEQGPARGPVAVKDRDNGHGGRVVEDEPVSVRVRRVGRLHGGSPAENMGLEIAQIVAEAKESHRVKGRFVDAEQDPKVESRARNYHDP